MARIRDIIDIEMWRDIPGLNGVYQASTHGRIRRFPRLVRSKAGSFLMTEFLVLKMKTPSDRSRYIETSFIRPDGKQVKELVHRVVCRTFHGDAPSPRHQVAHNDGVRTNNRVDNLRWATVKENAADRKIHRTERQGEAHYHTAMSERDIAFIREHRARGVSLVELASRYGITRQAIWLIVHRKNWKHV